MNVVGIVKNVAKFVVSAGVGTIVSNIVSNTVKDENKIMKVCTGVAAFVIGDYITEKMVDHTYVLIDDTVQMITEAKSELDKAKATRMAKMEEVK